MGRIHDKGFPFGRVHGRVVTIYIAVLSGGRGPGGRSCTGTCVGREMNGCQSFSLKDPRNRKIT